MLCQILYYELKDMGLIANPNQFKELKDMLGSLYIDFIDCVGTYINHPLVFKDVLDKFSNKKRQQLQKKENRLLKPKVADFFAGAGGLSLGFRKQVTKSVLQMIFRKFV